MANKLPLAQQLEQFKIQRNMWSESIALMAKKHFTNNFNKGGFDGIKWKPRKPTNKKRDIGRAVLVKSGMLKRSITSRVASWDRIIIGSYLPYAKIHNEGGFIKKTEHSRVISFTKTKGKSRFAKTATEKQRAKVTHQAKATFGAHEIKMPKREFIGNSMLLNKNIAKFITKKMEKIFIK